MFSASNQPGGVPSKFSPAISSSGNQNNQSSSKNNDAVIIIFSPREFNFDYFTQYRSILISALAENIINFTETFYAKSRDNILTLNAKIYSPYIIVDEKFLTCIVNQVISNNFDLARARICRVEEIYETSQPEIGTQVAVKLNLDNKRSKIVTLKIIDCSN